MNALILVVIVLNASRNNFSRPQLRNTFKEYLTHINTRDQQAMFKEMGVEIFI